MHRRDFFGEPSFNEFTLKVGELGLQQSPIPMNIVAVSAQLFKPVVEQF
ncbi:MULTISPECIES: hypothetical protein [Bradyrhizobium]|nr:hypothetical protein [Bradyrhizobium sp. BEA-2-5]WOH83289.1 hypothetical protein RX327_09195 [Bradyrhizobium sp. BEA-2-5]